MGLNLVDLMVDLMVLPSAALLVDLMVLPLVVRTAQWWAVLSADWKDPHLVALKAHQ